jgi:hypothetical protein
VFLHCPWHNPKTWRENFSFILLFICYFSQLILKDRVRRNLFDLWLKHDNV